MLPLLLMRLLIGAVILRPLFRQVGGFLIAARREMAAYSWVVDQEFFIKLGFSVSLGAALVGDDPVSRLVMVDSDGVLWLIAGGSRRELVSFCMQRHLRVYPSLGELALALVDGFCLGLDADISPLCGVLWTEPDEG